MCNINVSYFTDKTVNVYSYPKDMIRIKLVTKCEHIKKFECHKISNKTPMIIFNDADLNSACVTAIDGIWGYQGKVCE